MTGERRVRGVGQEDGRGGVWTTGEAVAGEDGRGVCGVRRWRGAQVHAWIGEQRPGLASVGADVVGAGLSSLCRDGAVDTRRAPRRLGLAPGARRELLYYAKEGAAETLPDEDPFPPTPACRVPFGEDGLPYDAAPAWSQAAGLKGVGGPSGEGGAPLTGAWERKAQVLRALPPMDTGLVWVRRGVLVWSCHTVPGLTGLCVRRDLLISSLGGTCSYRPVC